MNDETLRMLLSRADGAARVQSLDAGVLRRRAHARRRDRRMVLVAVIAFVALALLWQGERVGRRPVGDVVKAPSAVGPAMPSTPASAADVQSEIALQARLLLAKAHASTPLDQWPDASLARGSAAQTLLLSAQRTLHAGDAPHATALLSETLVLFPETSSAGDARIALDRLQRGHPR